MNRAATALLLVILAVPADGYRSASKLLQGRKLY